MKTLNYILLTFSSLVLLKSAYSQAVWGQDCPEWTVSVHSSLGGAVSVSKNNITSLVVTSGSTGSASFSVHSTVILSPSPEAGYVFTGWSNALIGDATTGNLSVVVTSDKNFTANFAPVLPAVENTEAVSASESSLVAPPIVDPPLPSGSISLAVHEQALADAVAAAAQLTAEAVAQAKAEGLAEGKQLGRIEGEQAVTSNPSAYNLFTPQELQEALDSSETHFTPYTPSWFYIPERGWIWMGVESFPWFYDAHTSSWLYFKSGEDKPTFYDYATQEWITLE